MACLKPTRWTPAMPVGAIRWGTQGKPVPGNQIRIVDPDTGAPLAAGEVGEITIHGPGNFKGLLEQARGHGQATLRTAGFTPATWAKSTRRLPHLHRPLQEMIKVSGYSVFPEEVETLLIKHPAVAQAAVIGVPDAEKGEVVRPSSSRSPGQDVDAAAPAGPGAATTWRPTRPREVRFIDAPCPPRRGQRKVLRRLLRDIA